MFGLGRIQLYIIIGVIAFGSLTAVYYSWRKGIEREALLEYNQHQIEQNVKDQEAMKQQLEDINNKQKEITAANDAEKKAFKDKIESISNELDSKESLSSNRPSSKVIKDTVAKLKDVVK